MGLQDSAVPRTNTRPNTRPLRAYVSPVFLAITRRRVPREKKKKRKKNKRKEKKKKRKKRKKEKKKKIKEKKKRKKKKKEKKGTSSLAFCTYRCALKNSGIVKK